MTKFNISSLACLAVAVLTCGCAFETGTWEESTDTSGPGVPPPVTWEEFRASAYREPAPWNRFVVDGDVTLPDEAALREYYDSWGKPTGGLTVARVDGVDNLWSFPAQFSLTYCISDTFGTDKATTVTTMAAATLAWQRVVAVGFRYVPSEDATCSNSNNDVVFDVSPAPSSATYYADSFRPSYARSDRSLLIHDTAFTATEGGRDFLGILIHELGHALGFRHEHIRLTPACTTEALGDVTYATEYDPNSVMHYPQCRTPEGGGYRISLLDYRGAVANYGLAPALVSAIF